jgi:hypothetical protein
MSVHLLHHSHRRAVLVRLMRLVPMNPTAEHPTLQALMRLEHRQCRATRTRSPSRIPSMHSVALRRSNLALFLLHKPSIRLVRPVPAQRDTLELEVGSMLLAQKAAHPMEALMHFLHLLLSTSTHNNSNIFSSFSNPNSNSNSSTLGHLQRLVLQHLSRRHNPCRSSSWHPPLPNLLQ